MKFGMRGHDIAGNNFEDVISRAKNLGVNNLQLALKKSLPDIDFDKTGYSEDVSFYLKNILDGMEITVLGCYINPVEPDINERSRQLDFFKENLLYAKALGAKMVGTETGSAGSVELTHSEETYQTFLNSMKELVGEAERLDVTIGVEAVNIFTIHSAETMARFLSDINSENVCVIFDLVNTLDAKNCMNYKEITDEAFRLLGSKIKVIHLKDFDLENEKFNIKLAGDGIMDYDWYFSKIKQLNPDLVMMLEEVKDNDFLRVVNNLPKI